MIKKLNKRNIPFTVVHSAAEVKRKLIKEFENTTNIYFPSLVRNILLTMNHKRLGKELANISRSINLEEKQNDK